MSKSITPYEQGKPPTDIMRMHKKMKSEFSAEHYKSESQPKSSRHLPSALFKKEIIKNPASSSDSLDEVPSENHGTTNTRNIKPFDISMTS